MELRLKLTKASRHCSAVLLRMRYDPSYDRGTKTIKQQLISRARSDNRSDGGDNKIETLRHYDCSSPHNAVVVGSHLDAEQVEREVSYDTQTSRKHVSTHHSNEYYEWR